MRTTGRVVVFALLALAVVIVRPLPVSAPTAPDHPAKAVAGLGQVHHVFVIVMENLGYRAALAVPGLKALAQRYASASQYYATTHPSLPNYIALTSGGTFGITTDCWYCQVAVPNLGQELTAKGVSWGAYMQGLPSDCWLGPWWPPGDYAGKHDPFRYYSGIVQSKALCQHIQPLHNLTAQLAASAPAVPRFVWITPNLCNDGHDCLPSQAAHWLELEVGAITASAAWKDGGLLVVTWDEGNGSDTRGLNQRAQVAAGAGGGHVLTLVISPLVRPGLVVSTPLDHFSLLKTVEEIFQLPQLGASASYRLADFSGFFSARP
ncbi:MAG: alkaline phosphatase family protein [Sulfobacillus sp.]